MKNENKKASWSSAVFGACLAALCCVSSAWAGVARIGGTEYDTLAAAFAAASNGDTVTLVSDATVPNEIAIDKTVTLDLATYRVTAATGANAFQVVSNGNFTVNADATNPGGITTDDDRCCVYTSWGWNPGPKTVTINNGSFDGNFVFNWASNIDPQAAAHYGVTAAGGGSGERAVPTTVVINGGVFDGGYENGNVAEYRCYYFTVNGGTFEKGLDSADTETCSIGVTSTCKAFFKGGKYKVRYPYWRETISGRESPAKIHIGDGYTDYIHIIDGDYYAIAPDATGCAVEIRNAKKTDVYSTIRHLIYGVWQHWVDVQSDWYVKQSAGPSAGANNAVQTPPLHMMSAAPQLKSAAAPLASLATAAAGGEPTVYVNTDNGLVPVILQTYGAYYDAMPGDEALQNCDFNNNKFVDEKKASDLLVQSDFDVAYVFSYKTAIDLMQLIPLVDDYLRPVDDAARSQLCEMLGLPDGSSDEIIQAAIIAASDQPSPYASDPYLAWETDFVMSFDRPVAAGSVRYLWGRGSGVVDNIYANDALTAGTYKRVFDLSPLQPTWSGVVNVKKNNHIVIGLRNLSKENYGTTVTVSLRHRSPDGDDSKDVIRASYSMTFTDPSAPTAVAQVTIGGVTTKYADLNAALEAAKASGAVCELLSDVDLTGVAWTPVADFLGTFDGKGYTISGLTVSGASNLGLFANTGTSATIKDLTISGATVTSTSGSNHGVLAGAVSGSTISNVKILGSTVSAAGGQYTGGLCGTGYPASCQCEIASCTVTGYDQVGGLIGYLWVGHIENCVVTNNAVTATSERAGGLVGKMQIAAGNLGASTMWLNNNVVSGTATAPDMAGGLCGQIMGDVAYYSISNNAIDVTLAAPAKNPIGNLRNGQNAAFTGALEENITGNTWTAATLDADSFQYTNVASGVDPQTIWNGEKPVAYVAKIGEKGYLTLEAAVDAAQSGDTITMLSNSTEAQKSVVAAGKAITIDLKGFVLDGTIEYKGDLTLTNSVGTGYICKNNFWCLTGTGNLVLAADIGAEDHRTTGNGGVFATDDATVTIATDINIYVYGEGIRCDGANLTITGEPTVDSSAYGAALSINGKSTALIAGGTYLGDFSLSGDRVGPNVTVTGGKFKSYDNDSVCFVGSGEDLTVAISGGIYSDDSAKEYLADGYEVVDNGDPLTFADYPWIVRKIEVVVPEIDETTTVDVVVVKDEETVVDKKDVNVEEPEEQKIGQKEYRDKVNETVHELNENTEVTKVDTGIVELNESRQEAGETTISNIVVTLTAIKIDDTTVMETSVKTCTSATFDVKPVDESGNKVELAANEIVTFRLPIASNVVDTAVEIFHRADNEANFSSIGYYAIQGEGTGKYVELSAHDFSFYMYNTAQTTAYQVSVAGTEQKIAVSVFDTWWDGKSGVETEEQKSAYLAVVEANGFQRWQNYVSGVDGTVATKKLTPICDAAAPGSAVVTVRAEYLGTPTPDSGVTPSYALLKKNGTGNWVEVESADAPVFAVDTSALDATTSWRIRANFTPVK